MNPEINHDIPFEEREYTTNYHFKLEYLHPRYWPLWSLIGLLFIIGRLPFTWVLTLGRNIGYILMKIGGSRVKVTRRNLELCFPEKSAEEREKLLRKNFEAIGIALLEPGVAWFSSRKRIERISHFIGWSRILKTQDSGQGVLVNALHMTCVEMACRIAAERFSFNILYRVHDNPVYEYVSGVRRNSYRNKARFIPRKQVKDLLFFLKKGEIGIILPDQDMGRKRSYFLPFFGIDAATIPSTSDFARLSNAKVVFGTYCIDKDDKYLVEFSEPLENFPSDDNKDDSLRLNQLTEDFVRKYPDQYLWQHRRFKTRPEGEPSLYGKKERKKKKR
ncbi:LpxL/LpxP family Kdo(2)-lipid IV(A) lauroyl/palmitoleoyl acyltransferase [Sansalvadorimonas sp. 2012CJ34-2]|uniref:LpxL/LpxP family Kdo(2)-lipid IV(A) lauroyl/palmitoleoyl acyltransferase n=1 Tax=Parendozoicomonas callyspongiae TaxID=2942213 RepID=A0ABT0PDK7_9GAMM|nr:LpxL/LpxP family Kdo(2)-lipid IV(A) lauroyl/palmitoleoyl acyltransferase [Sansalvadorimonas sp. 2012CJ34-2]MCL6269454.1 LpxL/LpxP family Kdo(2)-lipid IV(A) lauroyl/palmitoleoyl acyltransferase [Sansalvadorimonas sp. 2012CJ34-2]